MIFPCNPFQNQSKLTAWIYCWCYALLLCCWWYLIFIWVFLEAILSFKVFFLTEITGFLGCGLNLDFLVKIRVRKRIFFSVQVHKCYVIDFRGILGSPCHTESAAIPLNPLWKKIFSLRKASNLERNWI